MKRPIRRIAAFLLSFLLLLQVGGAAAAGLAFLSAGSLDCQDEVTSMTGGHDRHAGLDHGIGHAGALGSAQSDCTAHCTLGVVAVSVVVIVDRPAFASPLLPSVRLALTAPGRIERPPKLASC